MFAIHEILHFLIKSLQSTSIPVTRRGLLGKGCPIPSLYYWVSLYNVKSSSAEGIMYSARRTWISGGCSFFSAVLSFLSRIVKQMEDKTSWFLGKLPNLGSLKLSYRNGGDQ